MTYLLQGQQAFVFDGAIKYIPRVGRKHPQEVTQFSPRSHPRHLVEKRIAQNKTPPKTPQATSSKPHLNTQDIDVAFIEPIQSFLSLYQDYYII